MPTKRPPSRAQRPSDLCRSRIGIHPRRRLHLSTVQRTTQLINPVLKATVAANSVPRTSQNAAESIGGVRTEVTEPLLKPEQFKASTNTTTPSSRVDKEQSVYRRG